MASEVVAQDDVPVGTVRSVQELLQILGNLTKGKATCRPSFSSANFKSVSCFLISRMTAYRISSGQSKGHNTSAPKMVRVTGRFESFCSVDITNVTYYDCFEI